MSRLELIIDEREDDQRAFRYYSALHELSISKAKKGVLLMLADNKARFVDMILDCEDETTLRNLQGALQIIDSFINHINKSGDILNSLRGRRK